MRFLLVVLVYPAAQHKTYLQLSTYPAGNLLCIVMEYAPNGDLGRFIKKGNELKKAFPEEIIWKYFMQICEGMQALHNAKIIHRDIKPMNIFVGDHDIVKVIPVNLTSLTQQPAGFLAFSALKGSTAKLLPCATSVVKLFQAIVIT